MTAHWEVVCSQYLSVCINNITRRNHGLVLRVGDDLLGKTGGFISLSTVSNTLLNVIELQCTSILAYDNGVEWVPLGNNCALINDLTFLVIERRTIRNVQC